MSAIKSAIIAAVAILAQTCDAGNYYKWYASDYAATMGGRGSTTLTNVIHRMGTNRQQFLVIDGGTWTISNNVTVPSNIELVFDRDSAFTYSGGTTCTVNTSPWFEQPFKPTAGSGTQFVLRVGGEYQATTSFELGASGSSLFASNNAAGFGVTSGRVQVVKDARGLPVAQFISPILWSGSTTNFLVVSGAGLDGTDGIYQWNTTWHWYEMVTNIDRRISLQGSGTWAVQRTDIGQAPYTNNSTSPQSAIWYRTQTSTNLNWNPPPLTTFLATQQVQTTMTLDPWLASDGQALVWNSSATSWIPGTVASGAPSETSKFANVLARGNGMAGQSITNGNTAQFTGTVSAANFAGAVNAGSVTSLVSIVSTGMFVGADGKLQASNKAAAAGAPQSPWTNDVYAGDFGLRFDTTRDIGGSGEDALVLSGAGNGVGNMPYMTIDQRASGQSHTAYLDVWNANGGQLTNTSGGFYWLDTATSRIYPTRDGSGLTNLSTTFTSITIGTNVVTAGGSNVLSVTCGTNTYRIPTR